MIIRLITEHQAFESQPHVQNMVIPLSIETAHDPVGGAQLQISPGLRSPSHSKNPKMKFV